MMSPDSVAVFKDISIFDKYRRQNCHQLVKKKKYKISKKNNAACIYKTEHTESFHLMVNLVRNDLFVKLSYL